MKRQDIGYRTKEFYTPRRTKKSAQTDRKAANYPLACIPLDLWAAFRERCRTFEHPDGTKGISLRARILTLIKQDVEANQP